MKLPYIVVILLNVIIPFMPVRADDLYEAICAADVGKVKNIIKERTFTAEEKAAYVTIAAQKKDAFDYSLKRFQLSKRTYSIGIVAGLVTAYCAWALFSELTWPSNYDYNNQKDAGLRECRNLLIMMALWAATDLSSKSDVSEIQEIYNLLLLIKSEATQVNVEIK